MQQNYCPQLLAKLELDTTALNPLWSRRKVGDISIMLPYYCEWAMENDESISFLNKTDRHIIHHWTFSHFAELNKVSEKYGLFTFYSVLMTAHFNQRDI